MYGIHATRRYSLPCFESRVVVWGGSPCSSSLLQGTAVCRIHLLVHFLSRASIPLPLEGLFINFYLVLYQHSLKYQLFVCWSCLLFVMIGCLCKKCCIKINGACAAGIFFKLIKKLFLATWMIWGISFLRLNCSA